jgi:hypothetical protein
MALVRARRVSTGRGCGTGALTATIDDRCRPRTAVPTAACLAVVDALALPLRDAVLDVAVSGLTLNFLAEPSDWLREATRVVSLREMWAAARLLDVEVVGGERAHAALPGRP